MRRSAAPASCSTSRTTRNPTPSAYTLERLVKQQSGHVPVPISIIEKPDAEAKELTDGTAHLDAVEGRDQARGVQGILPASVAGQYDDPAMTIHYRAEGRQEYQALAFVPGARPFDLFDPDRHGRVKLYVRRVFITDEAELLPRYLRFVRGIVDSADLPLNVSREMIQESPLLASIRRASPAASSATWRSSPRDDAEAYAKIWENFGVVLKEGIYEDFERREQLLRLARFRSTSGEGLRSLADYVAAMKEGQNGDLLHGRRDARRGWKPRRSSKVSGRAASRFCCSPIRSTASG